MSNIGSIGTNLSTAFQEVQSKTTNQTNYMNFQDVMKDFVGDVNNAQLNADNKIESLIKGENVTMHDVMLSVQESQISMQLMIELRNKLVEAYQEVNRVQL